MKAEHVGHKDGCPVFYNVTPYRNIQLACFMTKRDSFKLLAVYKFRCHSEKKVSHAKIISQQS